MAGHDQCRSAAAGHRNDAGVVERACKTFEEIKVIIALAIALWSIATGPRATRAGSSRTGPGSLRALRRAPGLVDGAPTSGRRQAPQCAVRRGKAVRRSLKVSATSPPTCGLLVLGRINGDLDITLRTCLPPAIKLFMLLEAAMLRYCGIMAPNVEGAVTRARDSARPAAGFPRR